MTIPLLEQIRETGTALPKKQANACRYIYEYPKETAALSAAEFANTLGLGTATVTRLMRSLGFANYPDFRKALRKALALSVNDSYSKFWDARLKLLVPEGGDEHAIYTEVLEQAAALTREMSDPAFFQRLDRGVEMILSARRIGVLGLRSSRAHALTFCYLLHNSMTNIVPLSEEPDYAVDTVAAMGPEDLVVVYASVPYVKKTGDIARMCRQLGIPVMLITANTEGSHPLASVADLVLAAGDNTALASYLPQMMITELLTKRINVRLARTAGERLEHLDRLLLENGLTVWENPVPRVTGKDF